MTHCTNCGYELTPDAKFCPKCGQVVATDGLTGEVSKGNEPILNNIG
ncbi:hypothetical protein C6Y10_05315 [Lactiplantibacillus pentosus]|nr:hypothetical protein C6Y10_05315 [Lactiplantibacillus pentosus]